MEVDITDEANSTEEPASSAPQTDRADSTDKPTGSNLPPDDLAYTPKNPENSDGIVVRPKE